MAAPTKIGIDYFPTDVGLVFDRKFSTLKIRYGAWVIPAYLAILYAIYTDKGYYTVYDDSLIGVILTALSGKHTPSADTVRSAVECMVECDLFSDYHFAQDILTSTRVQKTYYCSTIKRKAIKVDKDIWLLSESEMKNLSERSPILSFLVNDGKNKVNDGIYPQSKVNKSKVKDSKVVVSLPKSSRGDERITEAAAALLQQKYKHIDVIFSLRKMADYLYLHPEKQRRDYTTYIDMWLSQDEEKAAKAEKVKGDISVKPSYDLKEFENSNIFDE